MEWFIPFCRELLSKGAKSAKSDVGGFLRVQDFLILTNHLFRVLGKPSQLATASRRESDPSPPVRSNGAQRAYLGPRSQITAGQVAGNSNLKLGDRPLIALMLREDLRGPVAFLTISCCPDCSSHPTSRIISIGVD